MWKPYGDWTNVSLTVLGFMLNAALANSGTIASFVKNPSSPPRSPLALSSDFFCAISAKLSGLFLTSARIASALAFWDAICSSSFWFNSVVSIFGFLALICWIISSVFAETRICEALTCSPWTNSFLCVS